MFYGQWVSEALVHVQGKIKKEKKKKSGGGGWGERKKKKKEKNATGKKDKQLITSSIFLITNLILTPLIMQLNMVVYIF